LARDLESEIDRLYQLPLGEFTAARNALAKTLNGDAARQLKALSKPSVPAWAVNQLYWQAKPTYAALIRAAERLRAAHRAVLEGRKVDLKGAEGAHQAALRKAFNEVTAILHRSGETPSTATLEGVTQTLTGLPSEAAPGRLDQALKPAGFEILSGLTARIPSRHPASRSSKSPPAKKDSRQGLANAKRLLVAAERELHRAREAQQKADAALKLRMTRLQAARADEEHKRKALERAIETRQDLEREIERLGPDAESAAKEVARAEREVADSRDVVNNFERE
jgi:hypothetical protein